MKIVVAVTGASGVLYAKCLIDELKKENDVKVIISDAAKKVLKYENVEIEADYDEMDLDAETASGSSRYDVMVVCPCSMKTLSAIAVGYSNNLVTRTADVMIKEKKLLVLVPRETPLSPIHLENMLKLSNIGVKIIPACPGFYHKPKNIENIIKFVVGKILDSLDIENSLFKRWKYE